MGAQRTPPKKKSTTLEFLFSLDSSYTSYGDNTPPLETVSIFALHVCTLDLTLLVRFTYPDHGFYM